MNIKRYLHALAVAALAAGVGAPTAAADSWDGQWRTITVQHLGPSSPPSQVVTSWAAPHQRARLQTYGSYANQKWKRVEITGAPGYFRLINGWTGDCLSTQRWDGSPGQEVSTQPCQWYAQFATGQLWRLKAHFGGGYGFQNKHGVWLGLLPPYRDGAMIATEEGQSWDYFTFATAP